MELAKWKCVVCGKEISAGKGDLGPEPFCFHVNATKCNGMKPINEEAKNYEFQPFYGDDY